MPFRALSLLALASVATATTMMKLDVVGDAMCGIACTTQAQCAASADCPDCIYGKCAAAPTCPTTPCKDSRDCPNGIGTGQCSRCISGALPPTPPPTPPSPTPPPVPPTPPAPCEMCGAGDVCCNPTIQPPQMCPGNIPCCDCGGPSCKCPSANLFEAEAPAATGHCGLGLPCGSPCELDGDCDQTGTCRSCGWVGSGSVCTHSN